MSEVGITCSADPWPVEQIIVTHLRQIDPALFSTLPNDPTEVCLQSDRDDRTLTLSLSSHHLHLRQGPPKDAVLVVAISYTRPLDPSRYRVVEKPHHGPQLEQALRALLTRPTTTLGEAAAEFWHRAQGNPHMPDSLVITAESGTRIELGEESGTLLMIGGNDNALLMLLQGDLSLTAGLVREALYAEGTWESITGVNAAVQRMQLGS